MLTRTYDTLVHTGFDLLICDEVGFEFSIFIPMYKGTAVSTSVAEICKKLDERIVPSKQIKCLVFPNIINCQQTSIDKQNKNSEKKKKKKVHNYICKKYLLLHNIKLYM